MMQRDVARWGLALALAGWTAPVWAPPSELQVEIQNIPADLVLTNEESSLDVEGRASIFGGMKFLDLFLILDTSNSLYRTDPDDYRLQAAIALVRAIPVHGDIRIGIVAFNQDARLVSPLTADREVIVEKLESLGERGGGTNLHDGIRLALDDFDSSAHPDAARIALLFTDGKSDRRKAIGAAEQARSRGMVIHSLLLLDRDKSADLLQTIAETTHGSFHYIEKPEDLPQAFRDLRTTGVDHVKLSANGSAPIDTELVAGTFRGRVPLRQGKNVIIATATDLDGNTASHQRIVTVRPPGCGELRVSAVRDGRAAISISDRGLEIIYDASGSMWGKTGSRSKIAVATETGQEAMTGFPDDFHVALRVYGHQHPREQHNCEDSELLIPLGIGNSDEIRRAIQAFQPRGQTPLGYSVEQVPDDFGDFEGGRSVVLITDGIESCDGNALAAAEALQAPGRHRPVHVIGFGLEPGEMEALDNLQAIAGRTGGRFIQAGDGAELRRALAATAGTPFTVRRGSQLVGRGTLGAAEVLHLPAGGYTLRLESDPPQLFPFTLRIEEALNLTLVREGDDVFTREQRRPAPYNFCK